jgi:hypothetical protein
MGSLKPYEVSEKIFSLRSTTNDCRGGGFGAAG